MLFCYLCSAQFEVQQKLQLIIYPCLLSSYYADDSVHKVVKYIELVVQCSLPVAIKDSPGFNWHL